MLLPKAKTWCISLGVGATPGITNAMVKHQAKQTDQVDEIQINLAGYRRPAPAPGLSVSNIQARYGADRLDTIETIQIFDGVNLNKA